MTGATASLAGSFFLWADAMQQESVWINNWRKCLSLEPIPVAHCNYSPDVGQLNQCRGFARALRGKERKVLSYPGWNTTLGNKQEQSWGGKMEQKLYLRVFCLASYNQETFFPPIHWQYRVHFGEKKKDYNWKLAICHIGFGFLATKNSSPLARSRSEIYDDVSGEQLCLGQLLLKACELAGLARLRLQSLQLQYIWSRRNSVTHH